ncbi:DHHW family protein [Paenibacillus sp. LHD-117]|uniref:DHHW family protein n=1 Tax=Paenibacillus sp. LHD-117 TaxID=3071412 RepID=UPI0027E2161A|nr:DHHW family protein [Paenibacillus sp. LHD-117]MDQ6421250.1 DHHW family protein [Paenibacillus sp. LHD-117]
MTTKTTDRIYIGGFLALLGGMLLLFAIQPKTIFSELENRNLQAVPELNWANIWSQRYAEEAELYVTDHFPFRSEWIAAKSVLEQLRLQKENNGIYLGDDGYLFEKFGEPDYEELGAYADAVKQFAENHPDSQMTFMLAPNAIGLYPQRLPWMADAYPQRVVNEWVGARVGDALTFLDGFAFLQEAASEGDRQLYYRTDHHWTSYGAYLAYRAYAERMGWEPLPEEAFDIRTVTESFLGSYHTKGQFGGAKPDAIQVYEPKNAIGTEMFNADSDETKISLYDDSFLAKKDKYAYFQGGVHALVTIKSELNPADADLDKLLIVKDSYAHSVLPFLANHVKEIHMIDIRYYNGNIGDYMEQNGIDDALLLFNTATFTQERGLLKLKY